MRLYKVPGIAQKLIKGYTWHRDRKEKTVYLTFDDGPVPGVSDFVLRQLDDYRMKASFFMVGDNVQKHSALALEIAQEGHGIGNHTFHHLKAPKTSLAVYLNDVAKCQKVIEEKLGIRTKIFRPPYGRLGNNFLSSLSQEYEIVLWDLISWDFKQELQPIKALKKIKQHTENGSIVLFHDQQKSKANLQKILPPYLDFLASKGFKTEVL
ncbi:polysaccharide deacetylase family protein [Cyclobacterium sediminis]